MRLILYKSTQIADQASWVLAFLVQKTIYVHITLHLLLWDLLFVTSFNINFYLFTLLVTDPDTSMNMFVSTKRHREEDEEELSELRNEHKVVPHSTISPLYPNSHPKETACSTIP